MDFAQRAKLKGGRGDWTEIFMFSEGDNAGHCSNGLTAHRFRESTIEEQRIYRKWLRGMVVVYCMLLLTCCGAAFVSLSAGQTQISNLPAEREVASSRAN